MSETKWTPGPWSCMSESAHEGVYMDDCVHSVSKRAGRGDIICMSPSHEGCERSAAMWDANARLISAAPDFAEGASEFELYEAAMQRGDDVAAMQHYAKAADTLRAALAKARGEQP